MNSTPGSVLWSWDMIPTPTYCRCLQMPGDLVSQVCLTMFLSMAVAMSIYITTQSLGRKTQLTMWRVHIGSSNPILTTNTGSQGSWAVRTSWDMGSLTQPQRGLWSLEIVLWVNRLHVGPAILSPIAQPATMFFFVCQAQPVTMFLFAVKPSLWQCFCILSLSAAIPGSCSTSVKMRAKVCPSAESLGKEKSRTEAQMQML